MSRPGEKILADAKAMVEAKKKEGWTRADFAAALVAMFDKENNMTEPENCLVGWQCPKCKQQQVFSIPGATQTVDIFLFDDGTDERHVHETTWEPAGACSCPECGHAGLVMDFSKNDQLYKEEKEQTDA